MGVKCFFLVIINKNVKNPIIHYYIVFTFNTKSQTLKQKPSQPIKTTMEPIKNQVMGRFLSVCCSTSYFYQVSRSPVNNLPSVKKKKRWICAAPHGRAPRTLVVRVKPESRQADKMWNSWRGQEGKFQTNIRTCGGSGGVVWGGFQMFSSPGPSKLNRFSFNASPKSLNVRLKRNICKPFLSLNWAKSRWFQWK